jgi:predicted aspartyl protease
MVGIPEGAAVMTGTFSIQNKPIKILFDSGCTHSFFNEKTQSKLRLDTTRVKDIYKIATPGGNVTSNTINAGVPLKLGSKVMFTNLITLGLDGVDVMVWIG